MAVQKYFLTEIMVAEINESFLGMQYLLQETHVVPFKFNFAVGTSRYVKYSDNQLFKNFLNKAIRDVKRHD